MAQTHECTQALGEVHSSTSGFQWVSQWLPWTALWNNLRGTDHLIGLPDFYFEPWHFISCPRIYAVSNKCCQIQASDDQPFSGPVLGDPKAHNHSQNNPLGTRGQTTDKTISSNLILKWLHFVWSDCLWPVFEHKRMAQEVVSSLCCLHDVQIHSSNEELFSFRPCTL